MESGSIPGAHFNEQSDLFGDLVSGALQATQSRGSAVYAELLELLIETLCRASKSEASGPLVNGYEKSLTWRLTRCESHVNEVSRSNHKVLRK